MSYPTQFYIVDIGASGGIQPQWKKFPFEFKTILPSEFKAVLFEPDPREFGKLKAKAPENFIILNTALLDSAREVEFHLCKKQGVSSIYLPNYAFLEKFPRSDRFEIVKTVTILTDTLDNQLKKNNIIDVDFVKIDTQGCELPILRGAVNTLSSVIGLETEVEFVQMYQNQPLFHDVNEFITRHGFDLVDLRRVFWKRKENYKGKGQIVGAEALYFKTPENVCSLPGISEHKILHTICIYLVYGYVGIASVLLNSARDENILSEDISRKVESLIQTYRKKRFIPDFIRKKKVYSIMSKVANSLKPRKMDKNHITGDKVLGNF